MNITKKIHSFDFVKDAKKLNQFLAEAKSDYVFWYGRVITHDGYEGYYPLNGFSSKVDQALPFRIVCGTLKQKDYEEASKKIDALSLRERVYCINNLKLLRDFCNNAYDAWENKNIFIKIVIIISEFFRDSINPDHVIAFQSSLEAACTWNFCGAGFHSFSEEKLKKIFSNWKQLQNEGKIKKLRAYCVEDSSYQYLPVFRYYVETNVIAKA